MEKIPRKLDGGYRLVKEFSIEELEKFKNHKRMSVFYNKGTQCIVPGCPHNGVHLLLVEEINSKSKTKHINLYSENFTLMTVDHIIPDSRGGKKVLENLQPMCSTHNSQRGNLPLDRFLKGERLKLISWKVNRLDRNCIDGYEKGRLIFKIEISTNILTDLSKVSSETKTLPTYYKVENQRVAKNTASDLLNNIDIELIQKFKI